MSTTTGPTSPQGAEPAPGQPSSGDGADAQPAADERRCKHCGGQMARYQDWCTQCGAASRGSIDLARWGPAAAVAGALVLLACGAVAVTYAALNLHSPKRAVVTKTLAQATPPASNAPAPTPGSTAKTAPPARPGAGKPKLPIPLVKSKLPKIPLTAITPSAGAHEQTTPATGTSPAPAGGSTGTHESHEPASSGAEPSEPTALVLDTDAASTYDPYQLPASYFGDPSLTIDGDSATGWTAQVNPATAPAMAEGVLLNLKQPRKLATLRLVTESAGMRVQVYGTSAATAPDTILARAWRPLSPPLRAKHDMSIALAAQSKGVRLVVLWISKAPAGAVGTPQAPGRVTVDELELFPAS